jgi:flagellin
MPLGILNNIPSLAAENSLTLTTGALNSTLAQLSSGSRINTGADDAAGLAIANGLQANITALTQSVSNANNGVGELQLADGALAQVTTLLNRAITLATESATGTVSDPQRTALQAEYSSILAEINRVGSATTYNGQAVFQNGSVPNLNAATSANNASTAPVALNTALTVGDTTAVSAGGVTFTYTAANATATAPNTNQQVGATAAVTTATAATTGTLTITAGGHSFTFTAAGGGTIQTLLTAVNAGTDATGAQAFLDGTGHLNIVDPNNNGNIAVTATGGVATAVGAFTNPTVAVTNPNQDLGSVGANTAATVFNAAGVVTISIGANVETFTASGASTVGALVTAINTFTTGGAITAAGTANGATAFLDSAGKLNIVDPGNHNSLNVTATLGNAAALLGTFSAAPQVVPPTVQSLINAINADTTVGAKAALVGGQVQITDPLTRSNLSVTTNDNVLGAPVSGAPTLFSIPNTTGTATTNLNELVGTTASLTNATALANSTTTLTAGGKTFTYTASGGTGTVGALINAINNPATDTAGLSAYLDANGHLVVDDLNHSGNLAAGASIAAEVGTLSHPSSTNVGAPTNIFLSDATAVGSSQISVQIGSLTTGGLTNGTGGNAVNLNAAGADITTQAHAQSTLTLISTAIANIASVRGTLGASVNRLTAASNVLNSQVQNLTSAQNTITAADIPAAVASLTKYSILEQTGIAALAQANQQQQLVLKLLQ